MPTKRAYRKWDNSNLGDDFLQLSLPGGLIVGGIDSSGNPFGNLVPSASTNIVFAGAPTGGCLSPQTAVNSATGDFYSCQNGSWALIGPTAGSLVSPITSPNPLAFDVNVNFKGPNPYRDVTRYGVRSTSSSVAPAVPGITATINSSSSSASISAASTFQNGDGVLIFGAGVAHALSTPVISAVSPSCAAGPTGTRLVVNDPGTGSTTYNYQIVARNTAGGLTAASSVATTTTGASTLGAQSVSITSISRSGTTNTCTTATAHSLSVGAMVYIAKVSDGSFSGWYIVATVADNTHFTYTSGFDTASGASTSSTGGSAHWFNCNHITWASVTGAFVYYIYGRTGGSLTLLGQSWVDNSVNSVTDGALSWDDFGSPMMDNYTAPYFVPTTPPVSATSNNLSTTILSGAGTTILVLAAMAGTSVSGATILFDNGPNIVTAATAAGNGPLNFPYGGTYVVNSYTSIPVTSICQLGTLYLNDTVQLSSGTKWTGDSPPVNGSGQSFAWSGYPVVSINRANPGIYLSSGNGNISSLQFQGTQSNNSLLMLWDRGGVPGGITKNLNFNTGAGGSDYMGVCLVFRGSALNSPSVFMEGNFAMIGGAGSGANGSTATPLFYIDFGGIALDNLSLGHRGVAIKLGQSGGIIPIKNFYENGAIMPPFMFVNNGQNGPLTLNLGFVAEDTIPHSLITNLSGTGQLTLQVANLEQGPANDGTSTPPLVSGYASNVSGSKVGTGYNSVVSGGFFSTGAVQVNGIGVIGSALTQQTAPSSSVGGAGTLPAATYYYQTIPVDVFGNYGPVSPASIGTAVDGTQELTVTWGLVPGQVATYLCRGTSVNNILCGSAGTVGSNLSGTSFVDNLVQTDYTNSKPIKNYGVASGMGSSGMTTPILYMPSTLFANLGSPKDGAFLFCSDCAIANPCVGSGTGAFAKRLNSTWVCN